MTILITGAAGKTGQAVTAALNKRGKQVRAFVRRKAQIAEAKATGATDVVVGDLEDPAAIEYAMQGATAVYHICPNMHPDEIEIGRVMITAAQQVDLEHFVYHSVLHPQTEKMIHHWHKLRVEEMLFESDLPITILQPCAYMQNLLADWERIKQDGVLRVPYPAETRLSLVDLNDVGEAAATVLAESEHRGAVYELVGERPLSQSQVAQRMGEALGRKVGVEEVPLEMWRRGAEQAGLSFYAVETLSQMFSYYADYGFGGSPTVLGWLLGRAPTNLTQFLTHASAE